MNSGDGRDTYESINTGIFLEDLVECKRCEKDNSLNFLEIWDL